MKISEHIPLDDPRVTKQITHEGKYFTPEGMVPQSEGLHVEPRMDSVMLGTKSWFLNPGDYAEVEVEDVSLLGVVTEIAEHHYDLDLFIDGEDVYKGFNCVSGYCPSSDGMGKIHWITLSEGKHHVRVEVSNRYNRMLDITGIEPAHGDFAGFLTVKDLAFPPPLYSTWMFAQKPLPSIMMHAGGYLRDGTIPAEGQLYLMDLHGHGSLETLSLSIDKPVVLEIMDGGPAEPGLYEEDFPHFMRIVELSPEESGEMVRIKQREDSGLLSAVMKKNLEFGSRLLVRLSNPHKEDSHVSDLYMEGRIKLI